MTLAKRFLALDTASSRACVAVVDLEKNRVLAERGLDVPRRHAEAIAGAVEACLEESKCSFDDIEGFGAGVGPGSFVGVRVAIATAKGFSLALQKPLVGFCSLVALAGHRGLPQGEGYALIDARRGEVYARFVTRSESGLLAQNLPQAIAPDALISSHPRSLSGATPAFLVGSGADLVAASAPKNWPHPHADCAGPDGAGMLAALLVATSNGWADAASSLVPNYCRAPDAKKESER